MTLFFLAAVVALVYTLRVWLRGRARFARVDRQGGSALLSKNLMEGAYWSLQPLARLLIFFRVTANQLSWASVFFGLAAGACLTAGHFGFGAVFATVSAFLDTLDGMVARLTGSSSDAGEVLDASADRYVEFFFLGGLAIYYHEIPVLLALTLLALMGSFMVSYSTAKAEALHVEAPKSSMRRPERAVYLTLGAALSPLTIPWLERTREFPVAIGHPMVMALGLVAVMSNVSAVERLVAIAKRVKERSASTPAAIQAAAKEASSPEVPSTTATADRSSRI